jgi:hypothetical protein
VSPSRPDVRATSEVEVPLCDPGLRERLAAALAVLDDAEPSGGARPWGFALRLRGPYGFGVEDPVQGAQVGTLTRVRARLRLDVEVLPGAGSDDQHLRLGGTFRSGALGGPRPLRTGVALLGGGEQQPSPRLGYQLHLTAWENVPVTVRGRICAPAGGTRLARPALSLELWRDASADGAAAEELLATGLLRVRRRDLVRAAVQFCRSAPPGTRPLRLLAAVLPAAGLPARRQRGRSRA